MRKTTTALLAAAALLGTVATATCSAAAASTVTITSQPVRLGIGAQHSAFPSMMLNGGEVTLVWRQGSDHYTRRDGNIMLATSPDLGDTWSPAELIRTGGDHRDPSISQAKGRTWLTWFAGAPNPLGAFSQRDQFGATIRIDQTLPYAAMTAPIVQLPSGELGAVFYGRQAGEAYDTCWMAWSQDGKTWSRNRISNHLSAKLSTNEPYPVVDGNLTHVFYRWGTSGIGMRTSTGSGHSGWGAERQILSNATGRPTVIVTAGGTLVMVYRKLPSKAAWIAYSADHGQTWQDGGQLAAPPAGSPNGMTYAAMVETSPGQVLVVYGMETSSTSSTLYSARLTVA